MIRHVRGLQDDSLTIPINGQVYVIGGRQIDSRTRASAVFVPEPASPTKEVWAELSGPEQLELASGLERLFAKGQSGNLSQDLLTSPTFPVGFSATQMLKAAVEGRPIGNCAACAQASLLHSLGAPPNSISLVWEKPTKPDGSTETRLSLLVRVKGSPAWNPIGNVEAQGVRETAQDPFFLEAQYVQQPLNQAPPFERPRTITTTPSYGSARRGNSGTQIQLVP